ncbi:MAG TPA: T9SS type A sorting domain-containing protein, partial [Chitinophagaceae bacterium]|nr:T9SS type A sorting domain-containing protein [Chitinophagaceae bacterium]
MKTGQLIWLDLRNSSGTPVFYTVQKPLVNNIDYNDEAFNITRMAIGADGYGYALTNDANHLIKFTTGNKVMITDMGPLIDDENNNGVTVHNKCSSWGGDIVADAFGKLYLFSASKNVFVIDPQTLTATYKGSVTNMSGTFSINGAAATDDENVIVSSANTFEGFYKVNVNTLAAAKLNTEGQVYNASDLASGNLLHESEKISSLGTSALPEIEAMGNALITIYPNPVNNNEVKITFAGSVSGKYLIQLTDLQGRIVESMEQYVKSPGEVASFRFQRKQPGGLYLIKITDDARKTIYSDKIVVE